ncbi:MAG TPA: TIGR02678 family protein [Kineosporiaceae bacterium]|nr:TIGR02678 family protein [Kineosporiaceae bacterium]
MRRFGPRSADRLSTALEDQQEDERRRAARALLRHPLLTPRTPDPEAFVLARRHASWLADWFSREAGWSLISDPSVVRLKKVSGDWADGTRPAALDSGSKAHFGRRRYVLLCLALAVLERAESQVTLGRMVDQVVALAAEPALADAGIVFTLAERDERSDLAAVARLLMEAGVLARIAGDEQAFVNSAGDVLYDVDRNVLATLLVTGRGPSMIDPAEVATTDERVAALTAEPLPDTDDVRNRRLRHRLTRRLLDDPVLYLADLDDHEREYLSSQRGVLLRRLTAGTGLVAEVRAEGIALIDPTAEATDLGLPEEGTDGHVTLLVAERLARHMREQPGEGLPIEALHAHVRRLAADHRTYWRRGTQDAGAEIPLTTVALARLHRLGLVEEPPPHGAPDPRVSPLPALARFRYAPARITGSEAST